MENSWEPREHAFVEGNAYRILFVCTGNVYRSPFAEAKLRQLIGHLGPFIIESAGTRVHAGVPAATETQDLFIEHGLPYEGFRAQPLTVELLGAQDLVICMAREHRKQVLRMAPNLLNQSFTLLELARILTDLPPGNEANPIDVWVEGIAQAARQRSNYRSYAAHDDVYDPNGRGPAVLREMERQILLGTGTLASWHGTHEVLELQVTETSLNSTGRGSE